MGYQVAGSRMNVGDSGTSSVSVTQCLSKVHLRSIGWWCTRIAASESPSGHVNNASSWTPFPKIPIQWVWHTAQESDFF